MELGKNKAKNIRKECQYVNMSSETRDIKKIYKNGKGGLND